MNLRRHRILVLAPVLLVLVACKGRRDLGNDGLRDLPSRTPEKLIERLLLADPGAQHYYSARADVEVVGEDGSRSFKANLRVVHDSAAWISVVPALGIEVARALLTPDSLKVLDKLNDRYFLGDNAAAKKKFGMQPSLDLFQQALLGRAVGLVPTEKYRADRDNGKYMLTSKEKRRFIRATEEPAEVDSTADQRTERIQEQAEENSVVVYRYWLDPDSFWVDRVLITDLARDQQADLRYEERTRVNGIPLPSRILILLSDSSREASARFELTKINVDGPLQLSFRIPEKFSPME